MNEFIMDQEMIVYIFNNEISINQVVLNHENNWIGYKQKVLAISVRPLDTVIPSFLKRLEKTGWNYEIKNLVSVEDYGDGITLTIWFRLISPPDKFKSPRRIQGRVIYQPQENFHWGELVESKPDYTQERIDEELLATVMSRIRGTVRAMHKIGKGIKEVEYKTVVVKIEYINHQIAIEFSDSKNLFSYDHRIDAYSHIRDNLMRLSSCLELGTVISDVEEVP